MPEDGLPTAGAAYSPLLRVSGRTARGQACRTERRAGCYLLACDDCCVGSIGLSLRGFFFPSVGYAQLCGLNHRGVTIALDSFLRGQLVSFYTASNTGPQRLCHH